MPADKYNIFTDKDVSQKEFELLVYKVKNTQKYITEKK